ncbi:hypothetical protein Q5Y75_13335 [Ruegeria sp. 2205SS24-7]|nr:hypothetical protein [Ruegeria sp. 2205SS24-7]MDP5218207.1 hypothetical protein [Ruegeria sp. 2205SS24-7]
MFGLIRLPLLLMVAFVAGVLYERNNQHTACEERGDWRDGLCLGTGLANE